MGANLEARRQHPRATASSPWLTVVRARARSLSQPIVAYRADPWSTRARHAPNPARAAASSDVGERVRAALGRLSVQQRQVLEIAYFEGLSQSEIAERLQTPLGTVKSWTRQGLMRLRELLPEREWV